MRISVRHALAVFLLAPSPFVEASRPAADPCSDLSTLNGKFFVLQGAILEHENAIRQLGVDFKARVPEVESEGEYYQEMIKRHPIAQKAVDDMRDQARDMALDTMLDSIAGHIDQLTPGDLAVRAVQVERMPGGGPWLRDQLIDIARTPPGGTARLVKWRAAMERLGPAVTLFKMSMAESERALFLEGIGAIAAAAVGTTLTAPVVVTAAAATLMGSLIELAADQAVAAAHFAQSNLPRLLALTESDLRKLKTESAQLQGAMKELIKVKQGQARLRARGINCDSTRLVQPPKEGTSAGKTIAGIALAAGAGIGTAVAVKKALDAVEAAKEAQPGGTTGPGSPGPSTGQVTFTSGSIRCVAQGGGSFASNCTGTIALNVGVSVPAGSNLIIITDPSQFMAARTVSSAGAPNAVSFSISQSKVNVDLSGNISCYPTQSRVIVFRDSTSGTPLGSASSSIAVTCTR